MTVVEFGTLCSYTEFQPSKVIDVSHNPLSPIGLCTSWSQSFRAVTFHATALTSGTSSHMSLHMPSIYGLDPTLVFHSGDDTALGFYQY